MDMKFPKRLDAVPAPPDDLPEDAARAWREIAAAAVEIGRLTNADLTLLELAARAVAAVRQLEAVLAIDGPILVSGSALKASPALAAADRARGQARALLADLGLTPAARR